MSQPATGRDLFQRLAPVIRLAGGVLRLLPRFVARLLWGFSQVMPGPVGAGLRYIAARRLGAQLGDNVYFGPLIHCDGWSGLAAGDNVSFHRGCYIDARGGVTIGDNVSVAHDVSLISFEHRFDGGPEVPIKYQPLDFQPITIAADVWIGAGVRVLAGTDIGCRSVVGAGAVVRGTLPGGGVWVGVPARRVREIDQVPTALAEPAE